ncbi:MAG TPA: DUF4878 domain-containing protein [Candidatus Prevotella stercoripullorum]|nr:DUF4878 domain-containing protein [Candidatus Prevotella stercoripullorum]
MKKLFGFMVAVVAMLAMASCGGGGNSPKGVAEQFIKAVQQQDGKKMAELVYYEEGKEPKTDAEKDQLAAMMQSKASTTYANNGELKSYEILSEEISEDGNEAVVNAKIEFEKKTSEDKIKLKKDSGGDWKIDMSK